jgi:hypothetical protein
MKLLSIVIVECRCIVTITRSMQYRILDIVTVTGGRRDAVGRV